MLRLNRFADTLFGLPAATFLFPSAVAAGGQGVASQPATSSVPVVPFDQASKEGVEPGPSWDVTPGANETTLGPVPLPASGYMRCIEIDVSTVTAATGAPVAREDWPWSALSQVRLQDTNGAQLDDLPGFALFLDNLYGGYSGQPDPRVDPDYSNAAASPSMQLCLWRELAPTGLGCLANQSASQAYKLTLKIASLGAMYSTAPTAAPLLRVRTYMHSWTLPAVTDMLGRQQQQEPPFHGTAQYRWYTPTNSVAQAFKINVSQVGNEIRTILLVGRDANGVRTDAVFPDPLNLRWDSDLLRVQSLRSIRKFARESVPGQVSVPAGVLPILFNKGEGRVVGGSGVNSWLPTVTATRLDITGTQTASTPGSIDVFVNDVSVAETSPAARPVLPSATGYHPPVAPSIPGAQ